MLETISWDNKGDRLWLLLLFNIYNIAVKQRESTKHGPPVDRVHGPPIMDRVHGPPIFTSAKNSSNQRLGVRSAEIIIYANS